MKNLAVARRYAKALILIGIDSGQIEAFREELSGITAVIEEEEGLRQVLGNPLYDRAARRGILELLLEKTEVSGTMRSFGLLLFDKGRIGTLPEIEAAYRKLADAEQNISRAEITSATKLTKKTVEEIRQALSKMTGKDIVLEVGEDKELIGGLVTRIGDLVYDGSIRTQLRNLRESFKKGEGI